MRIARTITTTLAAVAFAGGASLFAAANVHTSPSPTTVHLQQYAAQVDPPEDGVRFNCIRHGNKACGVSLDPTPNNKRADVKRYVIQFNKAGEPVKVVPLEKAHTLG